MSLSIFDFDGYKKYIAARLPTQGKSRGLRAKLAQTLGCQGAYVSQVLNGFTHFSLEHAAMIDTFLEHGREESHYFMLLVHRDRAGTKKLREYYNRQMGEVVKRRQIVAERVQSGGALPKQVALTYYQSWYYAAIHVLLLVSRFQSRELLSERLRLPLVAISEAVDFLIRAGLVEETRGKLRSSNRRLHLGEDSLLLSKHHLNWRLQALQSLDRKTDQDLHYSGPLALTEENATAIRTLLLNAIESTEQILTKPGEEDAFCLILDFFRV